MFSAKPLVPSDTDVYWRRLILIITKLEDVKSGKCVKLTDNVFSM